MSLLRDGLLSVHVLNTQSTLEGFAASSTKSFEVAATEAACRIMRKDHDNAEVLPISFITTTDERKREVDGVSWCHHS